jgi:hypothetical protein
MIDSQLTFVSVPDQNKKVVLAFSFNALAFMLCEDTYFKNCFGTCMIGMNAKKLKEETLVFADHLKEKQEKAINGLILLFIIFFDSLGTVVSLQMDGGKSVSNSKLLVIGLNYDGSVLLSNLVDTELNG